jgi:hypothetical protein
MPQIRRIAILSLLAAVLLGAPSLAQVLAGQTPGGAFYTIAMPPAWNGDLVIYNHGFSLTPGGPGPDLGALAPLQGAEGYAVAASSYRQAGWAVFDTNEDLEELYDVFANNFGEPNQVYLFGASLGGIVTARAIEQAEIGNVVGALPICGILGGSRNFDGALDVRLIYDLICQAVPGAFIPGGAEGLPFGSTLTPTDTVLAANACFGHDLPPGARTAEQQARLDRFLAASQIPQGFINTTLGFFVTFAMADLVHHPDKLGGGIGTGNQFVDYGDPGINAGIQRVAPSHMRRELLADNYTPTGNVGDVKIVSIHTDKDGLVIVENESEYASVVPPGNLTVGIVQEASPTHCGFSTSETVAAWETLRGWVAGDPQPSPLILQVMCIALQPTFGGDCRFNPFFQIPDMDGRIRPRRPAKMAPAETVNASLAPSAPAVAAPSSPTVPSPSEAAPSSPEQAPAPIVQPEPSRPTRRALAPSDSDEPEVAAPRMRKLDRREK